MSTASAEDLRRRIAHLRNKTVANGCTEGETQMATMLADKLEASLTDREEKATAEREAEIDRDNLYYETNRFREAREWDRYDLYWGFGWTGRGREESFHTPHSGDPLNRDFNTYIGRRCASEPEFRIFWNSLSKVERREWKAMHWKPPAQLTGQSEPLIYNRGKWVNPAEQRRREQAWDEQMRRLGLR